MEIWLQRISGSEVNARNNKIKLQAAFILMLHPENVEIFSFDAGQKRPLKIVHHRVALRVADFFRRFLKAQNPTRIAVFVFD